MPKSRAFRLSTFFLVAQAVSLFVAPHLSAAFKNVAQGDKPPSPNIFGLRWQWEQFQEPSGVNDISVLQPENYMLTLQPDGIAVIQADCNMVQMT